MKHPKSASIRQLLKTLRDAGIDFIIVGGAAATMHGSGTTLALQSRLDAAECWSVAYRE